MSWVAIGVTVGGAAVGAIGNASAAKSSEKARNKQIADAYKRMGLLTSQAKSGNFMGYGLEEIFGSVPEHAPYIPVDLTQSQLDTIAGNLKALPSAASLSDQTNDEILRQDLKRIRALVPNYDTNINRFGSVTRDLLLGRLPYGDVLDITANRSELAANLGTAGGSTKATLRDLGLSQLQATQQGASMFQQMMGIAEAVNPQSSRLRPQDMFFRPSERAQLDITQAQLDQQSRQSEAYLNAMPDPAAAALFQNEMYMAGAQLGQPASGGSSGAIWSGIGNALMLGGQIYAGRQQQTASPYSTYSLPANNNPPVGSVPSSLYYSGNNAYAWQNGSLKPVSNYYTRPTGSAFI